MVNVEKIHLIITRKFEINVMNKSNIGMIMLVVLVMTKAVISFNRDEENDLLAKSSLLLSNMTHLEGGSVSAVMGNQPFPSLNLLVYGIGSPNYSIFEKKSENKNVHLDNDFIDLIVQNKTKIEDLNQKDLEEEIPMEYSTSLDYGIRKFPLDKMNSSENESEVVPLDHGNTITDNIFKLFPRNN